MELNEFKGKKALILGLGREGLDTLKFLSQWAPDAVRGVADRNNEKQISPEIKEAVKGTRIKSHFGADYLSALDDYDIIIKSPGIPIHLPQIEKAYRLNKITSQTQIFFDHCAGTIIGVTGTKGKSTTASLINSVLAAAGVESMVIGNIGHPVLSFLANQKQGSVYVYELSAHQLYKFKGSPHISVLTNLYPEHLDYYSSFDEYILAKSNIAIHQREGDYFIYNSAINECQKIADQCLSQKIAYNELDWQAPAMTKLNAAVNLGNMKIAVIIGRIFKVADRIINRAISEFEPLPHRLELVGNFSGIDFYNDSLSTIQESAVSAIEALGPNLQTLIAGGYDRQQPFDKLARAIIKSRIDTLIFFAPTGARIWDEVVRAAEGAGREARLPHNHYFAASMDEAVKLAFKNTDKGRICLLSAASASFGEFRDYAQRGESFKDSIIKQSQG